MSLRINDEAPNFTIETTQGTNQLPRLDRQRLGGPVLASQDFTPVCTTELGYMAGLQPRFEKRNCKIIGLSVDPVTDHQRWSKDIEETQGHAVRYPLIGGSRAQVAKLYDMLPPGRRQRGGTHAANIRHGPLGLRGRRTRRSRRC